MKHLLYTLAINISTAIKRGILRIFPLPITAEKAFAIAIAIAGTLTLLTVYSCATPHHTTQLVERIHQDTVYLSNVHYDSIYIYQDKYIDRSRDTIYIKDKSVEYRYKLLKDTIYKTQIDSIPYEVTIVETKGITRPLTWYDHLTRAMALAMAICLVTYFLKKTRYSYFNILKIFK